MLLHLMNYVPGISLREIFSGANCSGKNSVAGRRALTCQLFFFPAELCEWQLFLTALLQLAKYHLHFCSSLSLLAVFPWLYSPPPPQKSPFSLSMYSLQVLKGHGRLGENSVIYG